MDNLIHTAMRHGGVTRYFVAKSLPRRMTYRPLVEMRNTAHILALRNARKSDSSLNYGCIYADRAILAGVLFHERVDLRGNGAADPAELLQIAVFAHDA